MVASAIIFLVFLFLVKNNSVLEKSAKIFDSQKTSLTKQTTTLGNLLAQDADQDNVPDWEEQLIGLDPTKAETTPGIPDALAKEKLEAEKKELSIEEGWGYEENLTKTDKFSRDFFSSVAALSQNGSLSQETIDSLSNSMVSEISNPTPEKIYTIADIKIIPGGTVEDVQKYKDSLKRIYSTYSWQIDTDVEEILIKFTGDGINVNEDALLELDPIVKYLQNIVDAWIETPVPTDLVIQHLNAINSTEKVKENVSGIQLYKSDPVVAMGAIKNYEKSIDELQSSLDARADAINQRLGF